MNAGPNRGWVVHPKELGKHGTKHPIFTWGAGASTDASNYRDHLEHWASHGFVIEAHASTGDGTDHKKALDYLIAQNEERDYTNTKVPVFMTVIAGANHIYAAREGLPPITAWLRWHLAGESERKAQFIGASCEFCTGKFASMSKGF